MTKFSRKKSQLPDSAPSIHPSILLLANLFIDATTKAQLEQLKEWSTANEWKTAQQLLTPEQKTRLLAVWNEEQITC